MSKHTPAPWKVIDGWDENGEGCFPSVILHGTELQYRKTCGRNGITINCSHDQKVESLMANAKLIAAAPELLEACNIALKYFNGIDTESQSEAAFHALNNAIKKATL